MATRQRGYGGGYRGGYNYRYGRPEVADYESFFNPIPIEFLQQQLGQRQDKFDTAYAGALGAKDQLAQVQVGMSDLASKNEIIQQSVSDINRLVDEKYGGDWGKASKEVARQVSQVRADPFWNAQVQREKQREAYTAREAELGARGMKFGPDPRLVSTLDEQGRVRDEEAFKGEIIEQGDWGKTVRGIFSSLTPDMVAEGTLTQEEFSMLRQGKWSGISPTKLKKLAANPDVKRAFRQAHSEFVKGYTEGDERLKQQFGIEGETLDEAVEKTIIGNILPAAHSRQDYVFRADTEKLQEAARTAKEGPTTGITTYDRPISPTGYVPPKGIKDKRFSTETGELLTPAQRKAERVEGREENFEYLRGIGASMGMPGIDLIIGAGRGINDIVEALRESKEFQAFAKAANVPLTMNTELVKLGRDFIIQKGYEKDVERLKAIETSNPELFQSDASGNRLYSDAEINSIKQSADQEITQYANRGFNLEQGWDTAMTERYLMSGTGDNAKLGLFVNQSVAIDGQIVAGRDKLDDIKGELGYGKKANFTDIFRNTKISSTIVGGDAPGVLVADVVGKDGERHEMQITANKEVVDAMTPSWLLMRSLQSAGTDARLQDYNVEGHKVQSQNGVTYIPSGRRDQNGEMVYYVTTNNINVGTDRKSGTYDKSVQLVKPNFSPQGEILSAEPYYENDGRQVIMSADQVGRADLRNAMRVGHMEERLPKYQMK
jgi:hypothetical protein